MLSIPQIRCVGRFGISARSAADGAGRVRVMAAVEPQLGLWRGVGQRAVAQALHPGGPCGLGHGRLTGGLALAEAAQRGQRDACILHLVRAQKGGFGQVEQAGFVLEHQPPAFLPDMPVLAMGEDGGTKAGGLCLDHLEGLVLLAADDDGDAAL